MTKDIPAADDPTLAKVKSGQINAQAACLEIFDRGRLQANGLLSNINDNSARAVLKTFNEFHRSWFQSRINPVHIVDATSLISDQDEPALHITRAVFGNNQYRSIVTGSDSFKGRRVRPNSAAVSNFEAQAFFRYPVSITELQNIPNLIVSYRDSRANVAPPFINPIVVPDNRLVQSGDLVGIIPNPEFRVPTALINIPRLPLAERDRAEANIVVNQNHGGGLIGNQQFLRYNFNLIVNELADEDRVINRRVAARVFEDLMCHELPTLSANDVPANQIDPNSPQTFRRSRSCMACHSQMDPFADGYRNLVYITSSVGTSAENNRVGSPVNTFRALVPTAGASLWALRPPSATLYYREYQAATPTRRPANNLEQLGNGIALSLDLYRCAAKRYYKYFTGVDVTLHRLVAPANNSSEYAKEKIKYDLDSAHQRFVLEAASRLRSHQSVRTLISEIISSANFQKRDFGSAQEAP